jgi:hypothetical protein
MAGKFNISSGVDLDTEGSDMWKIEDLEPDERIVAQARIEGSQPGLD